MSAIVETGIKKLLYTIKCKITFIILILLYIIPVYFDIYPSSDSYFFADSALPIGLWGMVIFAIVGIGTSILHGMTCISKETVYRGIGKKDNLGLVFPKDMPESIKKQYIDKLSTIKKGWLTHAHIPISQFNNELTKLNKQINYL